MGLESADRNARFKKGEESTYPVPFPAAGKLDFLTQGSKKFD